MFGFGFEASSMTNKCDGRQVLRHPSAKFAMIQFTAWTCNGRAMLQHFPFEILEPL